MLSAVIMATALLAGCVTNAVGPRFGTVPHAALAAGQARVYVFRDKVLYLAQGPGIGRPEVAIDGRVIGNLENGGFLTADVAGGIHTVSVGVRGAQTRRGFTATFGEQIFIDVYDKTRMAGARGIAAGLAGGAIGGIAQALQEQQEAAERHEGPIWRVDQITAAEGLAIVQGLSLSE
jgi:hypothetical protein